MYYTLFIASAIFMCKAQMPPAGVPLFNAGYVGQPLNLHYQDSYNVIPETALSQKLFAKGAPVTAAQRVPVPGSKLGTTRSSGIVPFNPLGTRISPVQLRSTNAKEIIKNQEVSPPVVEKKIKSILEEMKKESRKPVQKSRNVEENRDKGKFADSMDPVDQESDDVPKEVLGSSGSFSDVSMNPVKAKTRSPQNGEGIPDLDYLSKAANPVDGREKNIEESAKNIGKEVIYTFKNIPQVFQGKVEEKQNEEGSVPKNNAENNDTPRPVASAGLQKAMEDFRKSVAKSQLMQKYYGNQKSDGNYGNQYNSDGAAKNVADSSIKGSQSRIEQTESGASSNSKQENNPTNKFSNSENNAASNFAGVSQNSPSAGYRVPNSQQNIIPANFWQTMSDYVNRYAKNFANSEQSANNQFLGTLNQGYGSGYGGYPGYYGNGNYGYHEHDDHYGHHENHDHHEHHHHHEHHDQRPHYPYNQASYQNGYYPTSDWYVNGYYGKSPAKVSRNIAQASMDVGSEIAGVTSDSEVYNRSNLKNPEVSTSARNSRQMPRSQETMQPARATGITNSALMLAESILAGKPDQIANAGVSMGSRIAETVNEGQRFFKRSDKVVAEDSSLRSARQILPTLPLPGLMSPVPTEMTSTALNFAQGFVGANPNRGVIQPIVGGLGTSAGNFARGLGLVQTQAHPAQELPSNQLGQIAGSAINLAQGIMSTRPDQIANAGLSMSANIAEAANESAVREPRCFEITDSAGEANDTPMRNQNQIPIIRPIWFTPSQQSGDEIVNAAVNLAQNILAGNPDQIANSGVSMGTSIASTGFAAPRYIKRSDLTEPQNATSTRVLRQMTPLFPVWTQPDGGITNSALSLAQSILNGNPNQISTSGVNMGTAIAGTANAGGYTAPRFIKRSPQGNVWRSATGLAESIANSASVDPSNSNSQVIMESAGSIWKAATNLFGDLSRVVITPINSDQIVGVTKENGSVLPSDLIWESISDLAQNIANVTENPTSQDKTKTSTNSPNKTIVGSPNQLEGDSRSQPIKIANSATTLASRIASILMNPNVFGNPNLDRADVKSTNPVSNPVNLAGDTVALNPEANRTARMLKSYAPTPTGGYVQLRVSAVPANPR